MFNVTIRNNEVNQQEYKYIIQKEKKQKICFGSGCPRDTSKKGMNPFMKYYTLEDYPNVGPNSYNVLKSFKAMTTKPCSHSISKKGYSGIARFSKKPAAKEEQPTILPYNIITLPPEVEKSKYPFNSNSKRQTFTYNTNPGPGAYKGVREKSMSLEHSFGGGVIMKLSVDLKCCSVNIDKCKICNKKPLGDYWHFKDIIFLCRPCRSKEYNEQLTYNRAELNLFRKIRDCSVIHQHDGTNVKVWTIPPDIVAKWRQRETYLSDYLVD